VGRSKSGSSIQPITYLMVALTLLLRFYDKLYSIWTDLFARNTSVEFRRRAIFNTTMDQKIRFSALL